MKIRFLIILAMLLVAGNASSQTLDEYLKMAAENNANLKAKYLQYRAALERVPQVGALPDPQMTFSYFIEPMERYMGDQLGSVSLMQMFPWFGTLREAKNEMALMAKARFEEFNEAKSALFFDVRSNWYALQLLEKEIAITIDSLELLKAMERIAVTRFKIGRQGGADRSGGMQRADSAIRGPSGSGASQMAMAGQVSESAGPPIRREPPMGEADSMGASGSMVDVLRLQMEINELQNSLALLEDSRAPLAARFNQLLNRSANESVVILDSVLPAQMPVALSDIPDGIKKYNPMLLMLEQEEAAFMARREMNRKMGFPMIGLGVQYDIFKARDSMADGRSLPMPMLTVTLPIWRSKYDASVRESELMGQAVSRRRQDAISQLMVSYEDALKEYRAENRKVDLYKEQISLANQAMSISIAQYTVGKGGYDDVLRIQQQLLDYRLKYLNALIGGNIAVAMMERLMGR